jgi:ribonucleoside-diphosphate reductase alpha chain
MAPPIPLTANAETVLAHRYLRKNEDGKVIETAQQMFMRVAQVVAAIDRHYDPAVDVDLQAAQYYELMASLSFLPNSPTLMNAGTEQGQLAACFVLPIEDNLESIFDGLRNAALLHQSGGGVGYSFSRLRPAGDVVRHTGGVASGPVSFMRVFDQATEVVKQGGRRRGANMGVLQVDHPDILSFIHAKDGKDALNNFNLSVGVSDTFMKAVADDAPFALRNPRTQRVVRQVAARDIFQAMAQSAWLSGDPGVLFLDTINRSNPIPHAGVIIATNPCGEMPLLPYESCVLGSINLANCVHNGAIDWQKLYAIVELAVPFLDNVIDASCYPLPQIATMTKATRKIGLGVMGWADLLLQLDIPYGGQRALVLAETIMQTINETARKRSVELGSARGSFAYFPGSRWQTEGYEAMRNATVTTIAPTGTLSLIAGVSSGIEPLFAVAYERQALDNQILPEVNRHFMQRATAAGLDVEALLPKLKHHGSIQALTDIPQALRRVFVTAFDIPPDWHVRIQAAFQCHTDNAVSKTVNLPSHATVEDICRLICLAHQMHCKGITVFRDGSRAEQVLYQGRVPAMGRHHESLMAHAEYVGECRMCSV